MSEHDIADCPRCGKRDYVLKEDNVWICLNCGHTAKMPKSKFDPETESSSGIWIVLVTAIIVVLVAMGGERSTFIKTPTGVYVNPDSGVITK